MDVKLGDVLWSLESCNRQDWKYLKITGETRQSWILATGFRDVKVKKDTLLENQGTYGRKRWYTEKGKEDSIWLQKHKFKIAEMVNGCSDIEKLKQIKDILELIPSEGTR